MRRNIFQAIADPTRRKIISVLAHQSLNLNTISEIFDISRQAVAKHIKILVECGLITNKPQGRQRLYEAKLGRLKEVTGWVERLTEIWERRFGVMDNLLVHMQKNKKRKIKKQSSKH